MPPPPSSLTMEGAEFWGRYPPEFREGFWPDARLCDLHVQYLSENYFPLVGSVSKKFTARVRRKVDMNVVAYENETQQKVDRSAWGPAIPNKEAAYLSLAKYAKDVPSLSPKQVEAMNTAFEWMEKQFGPYMQNSRVRSLEEATASLDQSTSPGFPWTRKYAKKRDMIAQMVGYHCYMEDDWERLKDDAYVAVFGNSLKEEIRPQVKLDANSIRTFTAGPIEMTTHGNRLFEDMNLKFYASHLQTASVVGFSTLKGGWDSLYRKLRKYRNGFAVDETQYDASLRAYLMWSCALFRWRMLRPEDQTDDNLSRLRVYYKNLVNTIIITSDGIFVQKKGGNPSGSVNTISDNTLILYALLAFAWIMISPEEFCNYHSFDQELSLALCGDDNTWTVSDQAVKFFNASSLINCWKAIGVVATTDCVEPRPLEELDFLSAFTVFVDGIAVPIYNREKLLTSLLYSELPDCPSMTLTRACALQRVGWADVRMRGYLREFVSWLVQRYGAVLRGDPEWQQALCQIPTESQLRTLFLGKEQSCQFVQESGNALQDKKRSSDMEVIALPQRVRKPRQARAKGPKQGKQVQNPPRRVRVQAQWPQQQRKRAGGRKRRVGKGQKGGQRSKRLSQTFSETEVISAAVLGSATFGVTSFNVNPGLAATFPILSARVATYEKYKFTKLRFRFESKVVDFSTNAAGSVVMGFDYDASDGQPTSLTQSLNARPNSGQKKPVDSFALDVPVNQWSQNEFYVRTGSVPGGADIKTLDCGVLNISADSNVNANAVGVLEVDYTVICYDQQNNISGSAASNLKSSYFQDVGGTAGVSGTPLNLPLATATTNGLSIVNTAGSFVPPAGNYLVDSTVRCTAATNITNASIQLKKNGAGVEQTIPTWQIGAAAVITTAELNSSCWVTANGTDAFTVSVQTTGTGAITFGGTSRWVAV